MRTKIPLIFVISLLATFLKGQPHGFFNEHTLLESGFQNIVKPLGPNVFSTKGVGSINNWNIETGELASQVELFLTAGVSKEVVSQESDCRVTLMSSDVLRFTRESTGTVFARHEIVADDVDSFRTYLEGRMLLVTEKRVGTHSSWKYLIISAFNLETGEKKWSLSLSGDRHKLLFDEDSTIISVAYYFGQPVPFVTSPGQKITNIPYGIEEVHFLDGLTGAETYKPLESVNQDTVRGTCKLSARKALLYSVLDRDLLNVTNLATGETTVFQNETGVFPVIYEAGAKALIIASYQSGYRYLLVDGTSISDQGGSSSLEPNGCVFAEESEKAVLYNREGGIETWDLAQGVRVSSLESNGQKIRRAKLSPDQKKIVFDSYSPFYGRTSSEQRVYDIVSNRIIYESGILSGVEAERHNARTEFSADSKKLILQSRRGTVNIVDIASKNEDLQKHFIIPDFLACGYFADGHNAFSVTTDGLVRKYSISTAEEIGHFQIQSSIDQVIQVRSDLGRMLFRSGEDDVLYEPENDALTVVTHESLNRWGDDDPFRNRSILTESLDNDASNPIALHVRDSGSGESVFTTSISDSTIAISWERELLAYLCYNEAAEVSELHVRSINEGELVSIIPFTRKEGLSSLFLPDHSDEVLFHSYQVFENPPLVPFFPLPYQFSRHNVSSGKPIGTITLPPTIISPDKGVRLQIFSKGDILAAKSGKGNLALFRYPSMKLLADISADLVDVMSLSPHRFAISADGKGIMTYTESGALLHWDLRRARALETRLSIDAENESILEFTDSPDCFYEIQYSSDLATWETRTKMKGSPGKTPSNLNLGSEPFPRFYRSVEYPPNQK